MAVPETLGPRVALHLLNRAGYGPRPGDIDRALDQGLTKWVEEQLERNREAMARFGRGLHPVEAVARTFG